jgi:hypothetical protein
LQKVWEIAQSSMKSVGMMAFMMWMSGNSVQIFSIGITFTGLWQPLKAIMSSGESMHPQSPPYNHRHPIARSALAPLVGDEGRPTLHHVVHPTLHQTPAHLVFV